MKEIVYLDTKLVNSLLAQMDQGLILKQISEENNSKSDQTENSSQGTRTFGTKAGIPFVSGQIENSKSDTNKVALVYSSGNRDLVETAIDDFSLDILLDKIKGDVQNVASASEGGFAKEIDKLIVYDFSLLKTTFDIERIKFFIPDEVSLFEEKQKEFEKINKNIKSKNLEKIKELQNFLKNSSINNFISVHKLSKYMESLLANCSIFKVGNSICICEEQNIRIPKSSLSLLNHTKRKATIVGIVASDVDTDMNFKSLSNDSSMVLSHGPSAFINIAINSFKIAKKGDRFIRPIAVYFEEK